MIDAQTLRAIVAYDPETGHFQWRKSGKGRPANLKAGRMNARGYVKICVFYRHYFAHRLALLYTHGEWPSAYIDHINGDTSDNRMVNLRVATELQNTWNKKTPVNNRCGLKGVYESTPNRWRSQIKIDGKRRVLGHFDTKEEAHEAYCVAARQSFGEFANAGRYRSLP